MAGFIDELVRGWSGRHGFQMEERMAGAHRFRCDLPEAHVSAGDELPFEFRARWGHTDLGRFLSPRSGEFMTAELEGTVTAGGLCSEAPIRGTLELRYFRDATLRYRFEFTAQGRSLRFEGQKRDLRPWNLHRTHTTCYGTVESVADGQSVVLSDVTVRFALVELPRLLASFRLT
jgi:hypothetical protein